MKKKNSPVAMRQLYAKCFGFLGFFFKNIMPKLSAHPDIYVKNIHTV